MPRLAVWIAALGVAVDVDQRSASGICPRGRMIALA